MGTLHLRCDLVMWIGKTNGLLAPPPRERPPAPPAGGHASPHLCTRPQRGAVAPAGAPRSKAESGPERPGQAAQDGGGSRRRGCRGAQASGRAMVEGGGDFAALSEVILRRSASAAPAKIRSRHSCDI